MGAYLRRIIHFLVFRRGPIASFAYRISRIITDCYENNVTFPDINGEHYLLSVLQKHDLKVAFDVGANTGEYTKHLNALSPNTKIFSFEVSEPIFLALEKKLKVLKNVHIYNVGFSDFSGTVTVNYFPDSNSLTNIVDVEKVYSNSLGSIMPSIVPIRMTGNVITGDQFCREHNIQNIDFLKIDVEGAEHTVLKGFSDALSKKRIRVLQIEYSIGNIFSQFLLKNIYEFFNEKGYFVGKLHKRNVDFSSYTPTMENFRVSNFVAVINSEKEILSDLGYVENRIAQ